jgi:hypothetical protein
MLPGAFPSERLSQLTRTWMSFLLAISSALAVDARPSVGAKLSVLTLLTTSACRIWSYAIGSHKPLPAKHLVLIMAPLCAATLGRTRVQIWYERLPFPIPSRTRGAWANVMEHSRMRQCIRCDQAPVSRITLMIAGLLLSSFSWSCSRWWWLISRQASGPPSWTAFSFLGGGLFFIPILLLVEYINLTQVRQGDLMQRQLNSCFTAVWFTSCVQLVVWMVLEILIYV